MRIVKSVGFFENWKKNSYYLAEDVTFPKVKGATVFGHIFPSEEAREDEISSSRKEKDS